MDNYINTSGSINTDTNNMPPLKHRTKKAKKVILIILSAFILFAAFIFIQEALAYEKAPENMQYLDLSLTQNDFYLSDENYSAVMAETVLPYIEEYVFEGFFYTEDNARMHYETYILDEAKGCVVISHGYTENMYKYREVIYYFLKSGYNVFIMDHRGHGLSERETDDNWLVTIEDFSTYVSDFKTFIDKVVISSNKNELPLLLFAHSMGGAIGTYFLEEYPDYFSAAVLSSPMHEISAGSIPVTLASAISSIYRFFGKGSSYIWGYGPFEGKYNFKRSSTGTPGRYDYFYQMYIDKPDFQTNAGSFSWLSEAIHATERITSKENASKVTIPVLLFQAGKDTVVKPYGQYRFAKAAPNTTLIYVAGAKHEIFNSDLNILVPYYNTIFNFFDKICGIE